MTFGDFDNDGDLDLYLGYGVDFTDAVLATADGRISFAFLPARAAERLRLRDAGGGGRRAVLRGAGERLPARPRADLVRTVHPTPGCGIRLSGGGRGDAQMPAGDGFLVWRDVEHAQDCAGAPVWRWHLRWTCRAITT